MSEANPYKAPVPDEMGTAPPPGISPAMAVVCLFIFVSSIVMLALHAFAPVEPPGAPAWYDMYHVIYLIIQSVCAVGMGFSKLWAIFTLAIIVVIDVAVEILALGEWDPLSISMAAVMIYFLSGLLRSKR